MRHTEKDVGQPVGVLPFPRYEAALVAGGRLLGLARKPRLPSVVRVSDQPEAGCHGGREAHYEKPEAHIAPGQRETTAGKRRADSKDHQQLRLPVPRRIASFDSRPEGACLDAVGTLHLGA